MSTGQFKFPRKVAYDRMVMFQDTATKIAILMQTGQYDSMEEYREMADDLKLMLDSVTELKQILGIRD